MPLLIGTSGYSYTDWVGPVYPPATPQKEFLRLYAQEFPLTELNFSYYTQPNAKTMDRMLDTTPASFQFTIKGYKALTHERGSDFNTQARVFKEGIGPLVDACRLKGVLMQFPHSFHYDVQERRHLDRVCATFEGLPLAVEFRNNQWQRDSVYEGLQERGVTLVNVDEPPLPGLPVPTAIVTAPVAYVRFHGRNSANWWTGDNATRYEYSYSNAELVEWVPPIKQLLATAAVVVLVFNNHRRGMAVENARMMKGLLQQ